jgi:hypothetical protein
VTCTQCDCRPLRCHPLKRTLPRRPCNPPPPFWRSCKSGQLGQAHKNSVATPKVGVVLACCWDVLVRWLLWSFNSLAYVLWLAL